mmetsp:Transcript_46655/g.117533  ORF Transcript_46655/g.117533 Transcript_46655/m.117533 type:complete len:203 (+) Transcript_46655:277-885(+)
MSNSKSSASSTAVTSFFLASTSPAALRCSKAFWYSASCRSRICLRTGSSSFCKSSEHRVYRSRSNGKSTGRPILAFFLVSARQWKRTNCTTRTGGRRAMRCVFLYVASLPSDSDVFSRVPCRLSFSPASRWLVVWPMWQDSFMNFSRATCGGSASVSAHSSLVWNSPSNKVGMAGGLPSVGSFTPLSAVSSCEKHSSASCCM